MDEEQTEYADSRAHRLLSARGFQYFASTFRILPAAENRQDDAPSGGLCHQGVLLYASHGRDLPDLNVEQPTQHRRNLSENILEYCFEVLPEVFQIFGSM